MARPDLRSTGATVIGAVASDYAVNIHFEGQKETLWFPPELLEFADQAPEAAPHLVAAPKEMKLWFKR